MISRKAAGRAARHFAISLSIVLPWLHADAQQPAARSYETNLKTVRTLLEQPESQIDVLVWTAQ